MDSLKACTTRNDYAMITIRFYNDFMHKSVAGFAGGSEKPLPMEQRPNQYRPTFKEQTPREAGLTGSAKSAT